jgi:hypothetical protein
MKTIEYRTVDKSSWPRGPWDDEPDKKQWPDATTGLPCMIVRNPRYGNLCGYVGVTAGHPLYGKSYSDEQINISVHGSLTFSDGCDHGPEETSICHIPGDGEPDDVFWFGFDCAHAFDLSPGMAAMFKGVGLTHTPFNRDTYRTMEYVENEVRNLAAQLAALT